MVNLSKISEGGDGDEGPIKPVEDIIFTVDADIYEKTGVRKPKKGENLSGMEAEKIYRYQLEQDESKIISRYGSYGDKVEMFHEKRMEEITYATFNTVRPMGHWGKFSEASRAAREISWRNTTKLTGEVLGTHLLQPPIIANKRYQEWIGGKPKGPSKEFLVDKEQRKQDNELWENIRFARLEKSRTELREESKRRSLEKAKERRLEKERAKKKNKDGAGDTVSAAKLWYEERIFANEFDLLRKLPTKQQSYDSMKNWNKGHQPTWDLGGYGFPKVNQAAFAMKNGERMSHALVSGDEMTVFEGVKYGRGQYVRQGDGMEQDFINYTVENNIKKAEYYLHVTRKAAKKAERERKKKEEEEAKTRKRAGILIQEDLAIDAVMAKTSHMASQGAFGAMAKSNTTGGAKSKLSEVEQVDEDEKKRIAEEKEKEEAEAELAAEEEADNLLHLLEPSKVDEEDEKWDVVAGSIDWDNMTIMQKKKMQQELANPFSVNAAVRRMDIAAKNLTRNNVRIAGKKTARYFKDTGRVIKYHFHPDTIKRRAKYYGRCKCLAEERVHPEEYDDEDENGEKKKKKREWEKYSEEELADMDSKDRKRLKAMRARDLEQDAKEEEENRSAGNQAAARARKKEAEAEARAQRNPFTRAYRAVFGKPKSAMSNLEARKAEAKKNADRLMKEEANQERAMEMLFAFREKQRQAKEAYNILLSKITGMDYGAASEEYNADELIRYARLGNYNQCIDILDHTMSPVGPNEVNSDGISAYFAVLEMTLNNQAADSDEGGLEDRTCWQAIKAKLRNNVQAGKLDLVLRVLAHKGGDINFVKADKDADGEGILHLAAQAGGTDMIHWLKKKGANFDLRTTQLKRTALMYAARANKISAVMTLLKNGSMVNIDAKDSNGWTALHYSASFGSAELTTVMLICGADAYERNDRGLIPLDEAMAKGRINVMEAIRTYKEPDLKFRQLLAFMDMYYLDGAAEVILEADNEDEDGDDDGNDPLEAPEVDEELKVGVDD